MVQNSRSRRIAEDLACYGMILTGLALIMAFTGLWPDGYNGYNSYALQAQAWLEGHLDLGRDYTWLELAIYDGKYFVSFPPFPSYVLLPFAVFFGSNTPDHLISLAFTLIGIGYAIRIYRRIGRNQRALCFWVPFLYLGSGYLFIGTTGYVWFMAQTMCFTLCLMAISHAIDGQGGISLSCWACAVGCRPMTALYFPVLAWLLWRSWHEKNPQSGFWRMVWRRLYWAVGPLLIGGSYMVLNYLRFGDVLQFGHDYLPEFTRISTGQFSLSYFADNFLRLLLPPNWDAYNRTLLLTSDNGMAFWLLNMVHIAAILAWGWNIFRQLRWPLNTLHLPGSTFMMNAVLPILTLGYVFILCCHHTLGGWQFGNRYLLDVLPWLYLGILLWMPRDDRFTRLCMPLAVWGTLINVIGSIATYCHLI